MDRIVSVSFCIKNAYDSLGNCLRKKDSRGVTTYAYNEANQLIKSTSANGSISYTYDRRGNRIQETPQYDQENRRSYRYDGAGRLVSAIRGSNYNFYQSTYTYNGLGQRVASTLMGPDKNVYSREYVVDYTSEEYNDLAEYNTVHTQWNGDSKVHRLTQLYTEDGVRLETDVERYSSWSSEVISYTLNVHEDILGSGMYYTRPATGYLSNKHEYDTWGYNTKAPSYNYDPEYRATEPYFTGHPYDGAANLYYAHNRFYDAQTGQWLSEDPVRHGLNWYSYCGSNPVNYVDVLGLAKAYVVYQPGMLESVGWSPEEETKNIDYLKQGLIDNKQYKPDEVEVVAVNNKTEFINWWNKEMPDCVDTLILQMHGSPEALLFDLDGMNSSMKKDENGDLILTSRDMTAEEIKQKLNYKDINLMVNLCCDSLGDYDDEINTKGMAYAFQNRGVLNQVASKADVRVQLYENYFYYESEEILENKEFSRGYFYCLKGSNATKNITNEFEAQAEKPMNYLQTGTEVKKDYIIEDFLKYYDNPRTIAIDDKW